MYKENLLDMIWCWCEHVFCSHGFILWLNGHQSEKSYFEPSQISMVTNCDNSGIPVVAICDLSQLWIKAVAAQTDSNNLENVLWSLVRGPRLGFYQRVLTEPPRIILCLIPFFVLSNRISAIWPKTLIPVGSALNYLQGWFKCWSHQGQWNVRAKMAALCCRPCVTGANDDDSAFPDCFWTASIHWITSGLNKWGGSTVFGRLKSPSYWPSSGTGWTRRRKGPSPSTPSSSCVPHCVS